MIKFGSAGNPKDFYEKGFNKSEQMPKYLSEFGLNAYEYQCSRGVRVSDEKAKNIKEQCEKYAITLSIHAPYYISLSTNEEDKKNASIQYVLDTMKAAKKMGADRIVVHAGSTLGRTREEGVQNACNLLKEMIRKADQLELGNIIICPETMGKINQLGDSKEIIQMCSIDDRLLPTIDFGHLYCRSIGKLNSEEEWEKELNLYVKELGYERMKHFHSHFSKMEYTNKRRGKMSCNI